MTDRTTVYHLKKKVALHVGFKHAYVFSKKKFLTEMQFEKLQNFLKENVQVSPNTIKNYIDDKEHQRQYYKVLCNLISSKSFQLEYDRSMKCRIIDEQKNIYKQLN
jgi:hypothetical protein